MLYDYKKFINLKGKKIYYEYRHENNDYLVLLLHGFGSDMHERGNFDSLCSKLLESNIDTIRFDYVGSWKVFGAYGRFKDGICDGRGFDIT